VIELDDVVKSYGERRVLDRVSLTVPRGSFCVVVGGSGSGKSTALKLVNRLLTPSAGAVRVDGTDVATVAPETLRRRIGFVIQSAGLFPHWTVADNVATVPRLLRWPKARIAERVEELLALLQLDPATYRGKYPHQLSGGQQQRVGVARALAADPEILLMDEPFGALDPLTRGGLRAEIARLHKATAKTIVFVTHDMEEALSLADLLIVLRDGRVEQSGRPIDIVERPVSDFVRDFIGHSARGLTLLSLRTVGDLVRPGETAAGEPVAPDLSLKEAVSQMVLRGTDVLAVSDGLGGIGGVVRLADIVLG
jgi:osmoprotectant transport system ATP-binding protein